MTKRELINALEASPAADSELVLFGLDTEGMCDDVDDVESAVLVAYKAETETAHDDDCTPFVRVYLGVGKPADGEWWEAKDEAAAT